MRAAVAALAAAALLAGCGGDASPEEVVRAWSEALNADRNDDAADLFADGATIVQSGHVLRFRSHADAVDWNRALPCNGRVLSVTTDGDVATAVFLLTNSPTTPCDGPGARVTAVFTVRDGKIVRWEQPTPAPGEAI